MCVSGEGHKHTHACKNHKHVKVDLETADKFIPADKFR